MLYVAPLYKNKDWMYQKYIVEGLSTTKIAEEIGCVNSTINKWLRRHGISVRTVSDAKLSQNKNKPKIDVINDGKTILEWYNSGRTAWEISKELRCSIQTVIRRLEAHGVEVVNTNDRVLDKKPLLRKLRDRNWLYKKYITDDIAITQIADMLKTNPTTVYDWLVKHKIAIKDWHDTHGEIYTDEDLEYYLKMVAKEIGKIPSVRELNELSSKKVCPSATTYSLRGGIPYWQKRVFGKTNRSWLEWQKRCVSLFNKILDYPRFKTEKTFNWLRSPITKHKLKVDAFYPEHDLCVEFDGHAHFRPVQFLPGQDAEAQFKKTKIHDNTKNKLIPGHGLKLLRFRYDEPLTREHILKRLSEMGIRPEEIPKKNVVNA